ncbi:MAG: GAF domain-containing protein [Deltaproteobacteria bacterium]|nr:GAF domain-containing protein [Deltaproteobacteria bacterium]
MKGRLENFFSTHPVFQRLSLNDADREALARAIEEDCLSGVLSRLIEETEEIMKIDPGLPEKKILEIAAERIVHNLDAEAASIRLFDPETLKMTSFGSYRYPDDERLMSIPFHDSIAGRVVKEHHSIAVPSILKDPNYKNKEIVERKGYRSLLAVPLRIPRFMGRDEDILGSLQIYFKEDNRQFGALLMIHAELLARRVSYVLAKKKILDLQKLNTRKEKIVEKIFVKLSNREGVKLRDLFSQLIPEIGEFLQVQSCSLFSVSRDQQYIRLEAGYPLEKTYHELGYTYTVSHHPYFECVVHKTIPGGEYDCERVDPAYLLIKEPARSLMTSRGIRAFVQRNKIHSILLVPLHVNQIVRYIMMFYAMDQRRFFSEEEIELLSFFGREILKASRLELLDDVLHDFKNPAIAIAGFAARARKLISGAKPEALREKLASYLDIVVRETTRLQDLTFSMSVEGREEIVNLSEIALARYRINEETLREARRRNVLVRPAVLEPDLRVFCSRFGLERILDNLLNNASRAVPDQGGEVALRTYLDGPMAALEVRNTGEVPKEKIEEVRRGEVQGRGLNIIFRFVQANHGKMEIRNESGQAVCILRIPLYRDAD